MNKICILSSEIFEGKIIEDILLRDELKKTYECDILAWERVTEDIINSLQEIKWWDLPEEKLKEHIALFQTDNITMEILKKLKEFYHSYIKNNILCNHLIQSFLHLAR